MFKSIAATATTALAVSLQSTDCQNCYLNEMQEQNDLYYQRQAEELAAAAEEVAEEAASGWSLSIDWSASQTVDGETVAEIDGG